MSTRKDLAPQLADLQQRLGTGGGQKYWRALEELADSPAFQELLRDEFPAQAAGWGSPLNRRQFLTLMGASLALAGVSGCSTRPAPPGEIVPYVRAPEEIVPGRPLFYATVMALGGAGRVEQPLTPARASEAPISVRNCRRFSGLPQPAACAGNSSRSSSWNAGVSASSSRVRQYFRPPPAPRRCWRSASWGARSFRALIGGTPYNW